MPEHALISVVVPLFNEGENLRELISRLDAALEGRHYEFMLVDDGSSDDTREQLANRRPEIKVLSLSRNFGHQVTSQRASSTLPETPSSLWTATCRIRPKRFPV